ncbi:MAG: 1-acyl-sn-glycerol-3-phosphate acyltransferase [Bacteroidaceae bacterium]|mgnify:CR=1 FL=1|nr:1-acyl-sn-glycerol-3-phosphate acyltransferase [Bacteroidaceae bacterium]
MFRRFCHWLLTGVLHFQIVDTVEKPSKYIIALAPHTSNWDFFYGQLYSHAMGIKGNFLMKKEWFFWPLGPLFRKMGGIPVFRSKKTSLTDQLADAAISRDKFILCITPEGTRKLQPTWKRGFYYIALKAKIPILLYGMDYKNKRIVCTKSILPTGNVEEEMCEIKKYFEAFQGKHPAQFTTGL